MATSLGKWLRKKRIDRGETLYAMASGLGMTSSYLSAIELGKRNPTQQFFEQVTGYLKSPPDEQRELAHLIACEQAEVRISMSGHSVESRNVAMAFARKLPTLSDADLAVFRKLLEK